MGNAHSPSNRLLERSAGASLAVAAAVVMAAALPCRAAALGHPQYSAHLSSNKALKQQQLLCDPPNAQDGTTSTNYDPSLTSLAEVAPEPGYAVVSVTVEESLLSGGNTLDTYPVAPGSNFFRPTGGFPHAEVGFVQVTWQALTTNPSAGPTDSNTHLLTFDYLGSANGGPAATYINYGNPGAGRVDPWTQLPGFNVADSFSGTNLSGNAFDWSADPTSRNYQKPGTVYADGFVNTFGGIAPTSVSGDMPEPGAAGLLAIGAAAALRRKPRAGQAPR